MLGAAHALANPLTASHHVVHGQAVGLMLPHVVRFNAVACGTAYAELLHDVGIDTGPEAAGDELAAWLFRLLAAANLRTTLSGLGIPAPNGPALAAAAATQWTGGFNPRPVSIDDFAHLYEAAR
jgi:alcohol dehydrogenase